MTRQYGSCDLLFMYNFYLEIIVNIFHKIILFVLMVINATRKKMLICVIILYAKLARFVMIVLFFSN